MLKDVPLASHPQRYRPLTVLAFREIYGKIGVNFRTFFGGNFQQITPIMSISFTVAVIFAYTRRRKLYRLGV